MAVGPAHGALGWMSRLQREECLWSLRGETLTCRSRLAGDGGLKGAARLKGLIAGKPAPTMIAFITVRRYPQVLC
ncbi:hypothetical protein UCMB321_0082 [Pseudomonas batumici]|uniref:Uncharacterized protein n=1 Tax=Pseudomonas batumici TaxID=226910 RepID=A0A0C2EJL7_9PSED|nr:hypothetical protein UCMB321_0082 [Pseudomonas batumici]